MSFSVERCFRYRNKIEYFVEKLNNADLFITISKIMDTFELNNTEVLIENGVFDIHTSDIYLSQVIFVLFNTLHYVNTWCVVLQE